MTAIYAINLHRRIAALDDGGVVAITHLYDGDGNETDDPDQALAFTAGAPDYGYGSFLADAFPILQVH